MRINREKLDLETVKALREMFTHKNPKFLQAKRMGFSTWKTPPNLNSFSLEDPFLLFPRGALNRITELLESRGYEIEAVHDRSLKLERLKLELAYQLYPYQQEAVDAVVRSGNCVVRGPCGSGKTILILGAIAALKQPTLVIVHTEALKKQWSAVISDWLGFVPGSIGGGGKTIIRPITIGMQQTIWRVEKTKPAWVQQFGCIAIDECLEGNVPILMADGSLKKICDVQIDDIVAVGGRVLRLFRGTYEGPGFTINGWFVTPNHRIPTVNGTKRIDEMEEGDVVYEDPKRNERVLHLREEVEESQQERSLSETRDQIIRLRRSRADVRRLDVDVTFERFNIETENGVYVAGGVLKFNCHHVASRTFQVVANMFPAAYRVGASADEKRKDGLEHMIYDTLGPCVYEIKRQRLIDMDRLLPVDMLLVRTGYENESYLSSAEEGVSPDWGKMLNELTTDEDRNEVILQTTLRLLAAPKNRLLMLSERVQSCHDWKEILESRGHPCRVMVGGNKNETEQAIFDLKAGKIRIAIGTKIADEGLDIPQLTHVLVTCPVHTHPKRLEQMVGRAARVWEGKTQATAIYFWDADMFPTPSTYSDDPFKKRARKSAFFRNLRKACSTLQEWDIDLDEIFDVK